MKKVIVAIEIDEHFIRMLRANVELSKLREADTINITPTPSQQLALTICTEARGATQEQVESTISHDWVDNLKVLYHLREVTEY